MQNGLYCGIDVGSVAVKVVVLSPDKDLLASFYRRSHGQSLGTLRSILAELQRKIPLSRIRHVAVTGSGGKRVSELLGCEFINEIVALVDANRELLPDVRSVIEMGGEDSKLLLVKRVNGTVGLEDFAMNSICAAGTGSFLDQQASRLGLNVEEEFGRLALASKRPPRIAGRCSVFAKSDMIHLQQIATPDYDIVAGLCYAVARNFRSTIARGKPVTPPVAFEGGVAANEGMVRAFTDIFGLKQDELIVPAYHHLMPALGVAYHQIGNGASELILDPGRLDGSNGRRVAAAAGLQYAYPGSKHYDETTAAAPGAVESTTGYLGVDVGSLSTNVVVIDDEGRVLARRYLMTAGRPLEAVRRGLSEVGAELEDKHNGRISIAGCGTTGSGRYLVGDFIGADIVRNEITAQATAAVFIDPDVDTIFEIGGQDSKYISLDGGVVVDFEMNKACAAGTGSFLQEQAEKLDIDIEGEFGRRALAADCPVGCQERCTVFMESDLVSHQQAGAAKDDLVAGLAYSIVKNYLTKVVCGRRVGERIFFQGGVAWNKGVVAAFEMVLGKTISVPPHHDVTGAIGAALLARGAVVEATAFKGFDVSKRQYKIETFTCEDCSNMCEIKQVDVAGEESLYYGSRCEKYDAQHEEAGPELPDLFKLRDKLLHGAIAPRVENERSGLKIGIPRTTLMFELLPFWATLFRTLGYTTVLSRPSNAAIVAESLENASAETCFPIKITHGHVMDLVRRGVDYVFLPSIIHVKDKDDPHHGDKVCPYVQSLPYSIKAGIEFGPEQPELLAPPVHLRYDHKHLEAELAPLRRKLSLSRRDMRRAIEAALNAQESFASKVADEGRKALAALPADRPALVVVSRPYNGCDRRLSLEIPKRIRELGAVAVPLDFLPSGGEDDVQAAVAESGTDRGDNMYWRYGTRILGACDLIRRTPNLHALYITNFGCGPDSFITHFFKEQMGSQPYLQIEVDEHSADAGVITRIEAFLDSVRSRNPEGESRQALRPQADALTLSPASESSGAGTVPSPMLGRKVYIPRMCDNALAFAAAFRACGVDAEALPEPTDASAEIGRQLTSGKECYPCALTVGGMIDKIRSEDFDRERSAFFMPSASGPCRFGQYNRFQRMVLDELGYQDIPLVSSDAHDSYAGFGFEDDGLFRRLGWRGLAGTDVLYRMRCRVKPYETQPGQTEKIYRDSLEIFSDAIERQADTREAIGRCARMFSRIERDDSQRKPLIGVVGEIYLRLNSYANSNLVDTLEDLGAEVTLAPMSEWVLYTNFTLKQRLRRERNWIGLGKAILTDIFQRRIEKQLVDAACEHLELDHDLSIEKVVALASDYIDPTFQGEAILSVGKALEYNARGASGIVNAMPFTCMPGTIVTAVSRKIRRDFRNLPWLNMSYEGLASANEYTRLEAFVYQAGQVRPPDNRGAYPGEPQARRPGERALEARG